MNGILSLDKLRERGFLEEDYSDAELRDAESFAWEIINLFTNRQYENQNLTMLLDGMGTKTLLLDMAISEITSVEEDSLGTLTENTDFVVYNRNVPDDRVNPKLVLLNNKLWPRGNQNVTVVGRFGYTDPKSSDGHPPLPLIEVAMRFISFTFENLLEEGERDVNIVSSKRGVQKEVTDRWSYDRYDRKQVYSFLDDAFVNGILLMYRKSDEIDLGFI